MNPATRSETKNRRLASLGATLEYYDFVAYTFVAAAISQAFFPADIPETLRLVQTFAIYSVGFVARPLAGIFMSRLSDRIGRRKIFLFTLALMSLATFGIGVLPTYETVGWLAPALLLLMRLLQGCAVGGELPTAAVFVSEFAGPRRVGFSGAYLQAWSYGGFLLGAAVALLASFLATHVFPGIPSLDWRLPFLLGGVLGLIALYLRRRLDETPGFEKLEKSDAPEVVRGRQGSIKVVLREHPGAVAFGFLLLAALSIINVIFFQYWPTYLQVNLGHSAGVALGSSLLAIAGAMIALPLWGKFSDRFGWRSLFAVGGVVATVTSVVLFLTLPLIPADSPLLLVASVPAAVGVASFVAVVPGLLSSLFPTAVRQIGYSIPYNVGVAIFGGVLPLSLAPLIAVGGTSAPLLIVLAACAISFLSAFIVTRVRLYLGAGASVRGDAVDPEPARPVA
ncbi:MFS transporter [Microbacterium sp. RD1]|uniref:MFS transporter n=1 Tax=Microbacterium sp. RD1 TaxID=3457313 RepID=UPI003FA5F6FD